ncbi:hypothetical protein [Oscillibacter sp.]|uniref:peptidoglycan-binding domain-containing protein n=1 Tax=Oscillibacter sp. TaxID=1945593 RepID=UPI00289E8295|nr:hypothetical protein [Oscillibacter sp.]
MIEKAADWGIAFAAGSSEKKRAFLEDVAQGKGKDFLQEVADAYQAGRDAAATRGKCGHSIGSREYLDRMERVVFRQDVPTMYIARWGSSDYDGVLKDALESIAHQLERDLERNERENNYITDDTAKELKLAVGELERCGINAGLASSKIEKLAWFVGGDPAKIRELQSKLNQLGIGEHLNEDGVYGDKTLAAWETYIKTLATGSLPVAGVINPLQSNLTGISHKVISGRKPTGSIADYYHIDGIPSPNRYSVVLQKTNNGMKPIFRLDHPHYEDGIPLPYHMNVDMDVPEFAKNYFYNHKEISESTYLRLKDFKMLQSMFVLLVRHCWQPGLPWMRWSLEQRLMPI